MQTKNFAMLWASWNGARLRFYRRHGPAPTRMYIGPLYIRFGRWL